MCVMVIEEVNMGKTTFLINNRKNIVLLETETHFKICQKCLLLHIK